jgi:hypothetical protein
VDEPSLSQTVEEGEHGTHIPLLNAEPPA